MSFYIEFRDDRDRDMAVDMLEGEFVRDLNGEMILTSESFELECGEVAHVDDTDRVGCCGNCSEHFDLGSSRPVMTEDDDAFCSDGCAQAAGYACHPSTGDWVPSEEIERTGRDGLDSYCSVNYSIAGATESRPFRIGFEVEKEDSDLLESCSMRDRARSVDWLAVTDGSLDCNSGFELVSPCYNLADKRRIFEDFDSLADVINGDASTACGGHITVSQWGTTGEQLAERLSDFSCLLYALYPKRLKGTWSGGKTKNGMKNNGDKYRAVNVKQECVEFRLFSRVKNVSQLKWRTELIEWALKVNRPTVAGSLADETSFLYKHLAKVYPFERLQAKIQLFVSFEAWYDHTPSNKYDAGAIIDYVRFATIVSEEPEPATVAAEEPEPATIVPDEPEPAIRPGYFPTV